MNKRNRKIDWLKGWCMIAVIINHLMGITYENQIVLFTVFSVTGMILIAGYTTGVSLNRECSYSKILKRLLHIWIPYILCTTLFVFIHYKNIDFFVLCNYLFTFATPGSYYICVFSELVVCSVFLFRIYQGIEFKQGIGATVVIAVVAIFLDRFTTVGSFMLGAGRILGGSYLLVFCLGIWLFFNNNMLADKYKIGGGGALAFVFLFGGTEIKVKAWSNPPNQYTILYTLSIMIILCCIYDFLDRRYAEWIIDAISKVGQHSLFIYLFHFLMIDFVREREAVTYVSEPLRGYMTIPIIIIIILLSIAIEVVYKYVESFVSDLL